MKAFFSIFFLLFLITLNQIEARKSPAEDYWKHVMGDEPIPEAIADLIVSNQEEGKDPVLRRNGGDSSNMAGRVNWDHLINRDFDTRSVAIIYHHHNDGDHDDHHIHHDSRLKPHDDQVDHHGDDAS